jgi:hypothetical protein
MAVLLVSPLSVVIWWKAWLPSARALAEFKTDIKMAVARMINLFNIDEVLSTAINQKKTAKAKK